MDGADQTTFSFKAPKSEFHSDNERHLRYDSDVAPRRQRPRDPRRRAFIEVSAGQSTASVLRVTARNRTLRCCPRCRSQTARPLCFIRPSKIHSPSSIAQKGSISKPCPLRLGPGPLSVGKVFVAFVRVHGTQTAARQGQAADLHSRLRPSMAAPAQTRRWFEQRPRVFSVKGFLLLVCSHYLGSDPVDQAYHFHLRELTKEGTGGGGGLFQLCLPVYSRCRSDILKVPYSSHF